MRPSRPGLAALLVAVALAAPAAVEARADSVPSFDHVYVIVLENHSFKSIVGNRHAPYLNRLISQNGLATRYYAIAHPSQPNYLALFAGSTFGIRDDKVHDLSHSNLVNQLNQHDRSWRVYAQGLPGQCSTVAKAWSDGDLLGAPGWYVRKHEPAISFTNISGRPARCRNIVRLEAFDPAAADFELIIPNQTNDMHDGTVGQGDAFLEAFVPRILDSPAFANSLLVITFDEGSTNAYGGGRIATIVVSPHTKPGTRSSVHHDHYSLLRTIERSWHLGCMRHSCGAGDLGELFNR
ncbi:MAG TPA: alkaline phosphatase family protein [Candidatus Limnocylindrales bacterium]